MITRYTVENTIMRGFRADVTVNGRPRTDLLQVCTIGPFVMAWGFIRDAAGKPVAARGGDRLAMRLHIGIGRVTLTPY